MRKISLTFALLFVLMSQSYAQVFDPNLGYVVDANGNELPNTVVTAMPFLRIAPDARGGSMGDAGIVSAPTYASIHYNASNIMFAKKNTGLGFTYSPWLRSLNLDDIYLLHMAGYYKLDDNQFVAAGLRYFSLGEIQFKDSGGNDLDRGNPREGEFALTYGRKLGDNLSAAITGKYVYSNLATGQQVDNRDITTASSFAADVSATYKSKIEMGGYDAELKFGLAVTNIGSKVSYFTDEKIKDFIPTNLGIGSGLKLELDEYNSIEFIMDINKLMIPSPINEKIKKDGKDVVNPDYDKNEDGVADYRQKSLVSGMFGSFGDAQGGFKEELKEYTISVGTEYWYADQFALRAGYFYESESKGGRNFLTLGVGLKYNVFGIDLSYLVPTTSTRRSPLDNTLRFGLSFDLDSE